MAPKNHHEKRKNPYYLVKDQQQSSSSDNHNILDSDISEENEAVIRNFSSSNIKQSGNSDVDVHIDVHIDNSAVAYAILCSLYATKQMSVQEFNTAVQKLKELIGKNNSSLDRTFRNNSSKSSYRKYKSGND